MAGKLISKATCTFVVPDNTSEDVDVDYGGDSTYAAADTSVYVDVGGGD
jgi:hypothetical protein